jgi:hypothetical protein
MPVKTGCKKNVTQNLRKMKPFEIEFDIIGEIRHGSAYNLAELNIVGKSDFKIKRNNDWQNIQSWTKDYKYFAVVKWDIKNSEPGFRVILFDSKNGQLEKTDRISGCCNKIKFAKELNIDCEIFTLTSQPFKKREYGIITKKIKTGYSNL